MRETNTILGLIHERGTKGLPLERVQRLLYTPDLYLTAYGKLYRNKGAMTEGTTEETVEGMSQEKIEQTIKALRDGTFQWKPVRRVYIPKKDGKKRPLGRAFLAIKASTGSHTPDTERVLRASVFRTLSRMRDQSAAVTQPSEISRSGTVQRGSLRETSPHVLIA
jgi:hypothetical protein